MFYFVKTLIYLLLPPGFFLILLLILFFILKHIKVAKALLIFIIFIVYLLSIPPVKSSLFWGLEKDFFEQKKIVSSKQEYIVTILGAGSNNRADTSRFSGLPSEAVKRLVYAWRIAQKYKFKLLLSGGNVYKRDSIIKNEVNLMKEFLEKLGFDSSRIIIEEQSRNTRENAAYSCKILKLNEVKKTILVTSAYHMRRAQKCFQQNGIEVVPFPVDFRSRDNKSFIIFDFFPDMSSLNDSVRALREYYANIYYFW